MPEAQPYMLSPRGKRLLSLGGEYSWKQFTKGDVVCSLQWVNDEPCMCLFPALQNNRAGAFVIALSALHKYCESDGHPTRYMLQASIDIASHLGFKPGKDICFRIADIILDAAPDLVRMPPTPQVVKDEHKPDPVGELSIKAGGRIVHEAVV